MLVLGAWTVTDYSTLDNAELNKLCAEVLNIPFDDRMPSIRWSATEHCEDFEDIKREIERRGWGWKATSGYRDHNELRQYRFTVHCGFGSRAEVTNFAPTESRAGCIAFLRAVEATK